MSKMVKKRKTISVETIRNKVNYMLRQPGGDAAYRQGVMDLLNFVLHETGNYHGFGYLTSQNLEDQSDVPGIRDGDTYYQSERFYNTDSTRVHYY